MGVKEKGCLSQPEISEYCFKSKSGLEEHNSDGNGHSWLKWFWFTFPDMNRVAKYIHPSCDDIVVRHICKAQRKCCGMVKTALKAKGNEEMTDM